jgi:glycosyltransferase involved in cell wall biosynthesis
LLGDDASACSVMFEHYEILAEGGGDFALRFLGDVSDADVFLTIDIYDLDNPVHPAGHVGWWRFPVEALGERISGQVHVRNDGIDVSLVDVVSEDHWINEPSRFPSRAIVNAVLRSKSTNSIVSLHQISAFATVQDRSEFRSRFNRDWQVPRFASPHYVPPARTTVRIVSQSIHLHDAIGHLCLDLYRMLRQHGIAVEMYAEQFNLELNDIVRPVSRLSSEGKKDDYVLYFFSIFDKYLPEILNLTAARKIAYFHGITPPRLLQAFDPELSVACKRALGQLPELARFDVLAANSFATAHDLVQTLAEGDRHKDKVKVIAPCLTWKRAPPEANRRVGSSHACLLYVGQLRPHKRIEHLLELFAAYQDLCPDAECWIVGAKPDAAYEAYLGWVEQTQLSIPPARIRWFGRVSDEELQKIYRSASAYISMSEHEGFCLPVLEAMAAGLPVISYAQPAIQEVLGNSGITFFDKDFAYLAHYLRALLDAPDRLAEIVTRQQDRATALMRDTDGIAFWRLLLPELRPSRAGLKT